MKNKIVLISAILLICSLAPIKSNAASENALKVIYPPRESENDTRDDDLVEILKTALDKTIEAFGPYTMRPAIQMNEGRFRKELKAGANINVIWTVATQEAENDFLSVNIPLRKGILGYRVLLIDKKNKEKFASIKNLDDLKRISIGQGHAWNDNNVLQANGIKVVPVTEYERLFDMLMKGRFDAFSRGINEAPAELEARKNKYPDMMIEETLLLYYPWPKFFYVNKENKALAERLSKGLEIMIKDGTYDTLFLKNNQKYIDAVNLRGRRLIRLKNPLLPASVPLDRSELWYDPSKQDKN